MENVDEVEISKRIKFFFFSFSLFSSFFPLIRVFSLYYLFRQYGGELTKGVFSIPVRIVNGDWSG